MLTSINAIDLHLYKSIRAVNSRTDFIFKNKNGEINPRLDEDLPYDINQNLIVLKDADFGIFYVDVTEYIRRYIGKSKCFGSHYRYSVDSGMSGTGRKNHQHILNKGEYKNGK